MNNYKNDWLPGNGIDESEFLSEWGIKGIRLLEVFFFGWGVLQKCWNVAEIEIVELVVLKILCVHPCNY